MAEEDHQPPRARARVESSSSTSGSRSRSASSNQPISARVGTNPLQFLTQVYRPCEANEGIRAYYSRLIRGAEEEVKAFPPAFVSMAGGTVHDVFKDATDCLVCMAQSIKTNTVNGMCTRPRQRPDGTVLYPAFWDMDIYSSKVCTPDDFQFMLREFLCPTMALFFDDDVHREAMQKTHFAVYYSQVEGAPHLARQTKSKLVCGMCGKGALYRSVENMEPYAECKLCGIRFACSSMNGGADTISTEPLMFSKPHFLKAHRSRMPFVQPGSMIEPEKWTRVADVNWDSEVLSFDYGALQVRTQLRFFEAHIDKTAFKYGVHIKALNVEWLARKRRANIGLCRNLDAYLSQCKRKPKTARGQALKYLTKVKKVIASNNKSVGTYMTPAEIQTRAMAQLPMLFLTEQAHGASQEVPDLDQYVAHKVDTLLFSPDMAVMLCDYLATKAIRWQETLPEDHFWKDVDMNEAFDKAVYSSGLRVPYAPKILTCKHVRHHGRADEASAICLRCGGSGKYPETERPPYRLQMVVDAKGEKHDALTRYLESNLAGQLALTTIRLPILGTLKGTIVRETGHARIQMANIPRTNTSVRSGIPENQSMQADIGGSWQSYLGADTEITRRDVIEPLQTWIRQLRPEWSGLRIKQMKKKRSAGRSDALPEYWVSLDPRSEGVHNCPYHHGDHTGGTIYFLVKPPTTKTELKTMHGQILYYCWSGGCPGNKCRMSLRKRAHLPEGLVTRVWDPTSFVAASGRLGDLSVTLSAISRRHVAGRDARVDEIRRLVGDTGHLDNSLADGSAAADAPAVPGDHGPIPGVELLLGDPRTEFVGGGHQSTGGLGANGIEDVEEGVDTPVLGAYPTASVYSAMSGNLLVACHAQMYKQYNAQCKPTSVFGTVFTAMNQ